MNNKPELKDSDLILYLQRLINKIYKLMPMKENKEKTYDTYIDKLIQQLQVGNELAIFNKKFIEIISNLNTLKRIDDIKKHNFIVKESIYICKRLIYSIELKGE